jgi:hypothetical protein
VLASNGGMVRLLERMDLEWTRAADPELGPTIVRMTAPLTSSGKPGLPPAKNG